MFGRDGQSQTKPYEAETAQKFRLRYWHWRYQLLIAALLVALGLATGVIAQRAHSLLVRAIESQYFVLVALSVSAIGAATLLYAGSRPGPG